MVANSSSNSLFNLISHQPDIDKNYLCSEDRYEAKCQFFKGELRKKIILFLLNSIENIEKLSLNSFKIAKYKKEV